MEQYNQVYNQQVIVSFSFIDHPGGVQSKTDAKPGVVNQDWSKGHVREVQLNRIHQYRVSGIQDPVQEVGLPIGLIVHVRDEVVLIVVWFCGMWLGQAEHKGGGV